MKRLAALIAVSLAVGCGPRTEGSGVAKTETRAVPAFTEISGATGVEIGVHVGGARSVEIAGDDNVLPLVETEVSGDRLRVRFKSGASVTTKIPLHVDVTTPTLKYLAGSSGSHITASGVAGDTLELEASSGASVDAGELAAKSVAVHASSGANLAARAIDSVHGEASSGASVRVIGSPKARSVATSSGANVSYP